MKTPVIQHVPDAEGQPEPRAAQSPSQQRRHLAARMARWSAHHRKKAVLIWFAFVVASFAFSIISPMKNIVYETSGPGESGEANAILYEDFAQPATETVLIESDSLSATDPEFEATIVAVTSSLSSLESVASVDAPIDGSHPGLISDDGHSALVELEIDGPAEDATDKIDPIIDEVAAVQQAHPDLYVGSFGVSTDKALQQSFFDDLKKAGLYSVPLTLVILLVAFGALVAAGIPLLLGLSAVLATLGIVSLVSQVLPMDESVSAIILLIGLAVGVDYTMFYLKREREERAKGRSEEAALEAAGPGR